MIIDSDEKARNAPLGLNEMGSTSAVQPMVSDSAALRRLMRWEEMCARVAELEHGLRCIVGALDDHLGDTDPAVTADMADDEVREEYPILWACAEANRLLNR